MLKLPSTELRTSLFLPAGRTGGFIAVAIDERMISTSRAKTVRNEGISKKTGFQKPK
ncbi:MAG: hypothetical protein ACI9FN_001738 [Saprospiraceae bacterium]|jgi:hypothetical protein